MGTATKTERELKVVGKGGGATRGTRWWTNSKDSQLEVNTRKYIFRADFQQR